MVILPLSFFHLTNGELLGPFHKGSASVNTLFCHCIVDITSEHLLCVGHLAFVLGEQHEQTHSAVFTAKNLYGLSVGLLAIDSQVVVCGYPNFHINSY